LSPATRAQPPVGGRYFKVYRQYKAYNDPMLSPDKLT